MTVKMATKTEQIVENETTKVDPSSIGGHDELNELSRDYAQYLSIDTAKESQQFDENIEELLTRLDEYCGLVDIVRSDTNLCLGKTLPAIHQKSEQMNSIFERIDKLEAFVALVKQQVLTMEMQLEQAEEHMGTFGTFKKIFSSFPLANFFGKRTTPQPVTVPRPPKFTPPEIYKTEDYIHYAQFARSKSAESKMSRSASNPAESPVESSNSPPEEPENSDQKQRSLTVS